MNDLYCWTSNNTQDCTITKTVIYKCGCKVKLGNYLQHDAPFACVIHTDGIKKIITTEEIIFNERVL